MSFPVAFDDSAHVGNAFFGQVGQTARCVNFSTAALRGRDEGLDGEHDAAEIRKARVRTQHGQAVHATDALAAVDQHGVILPSLNHAVGNLLLEWFGDVSCTQDMFRRGKGSPRFNSEVAGDADQTAQFASRRESLPRRPALRCASRRIMETALLSK